MDAEATVAAGRCLVLSSRARPLVVAGQGSPSDGLSRKRSHASPSRVATHISRGTSSSPDRVLQQAAEEPHAVRPSHLQVERGRRARGSRRPQTVEDEGRGVVGRGRLLREQTRSPDRFGIGGAGHGRKRGTPPPHEPRRLLAGEAVQDADPHVGETAGEAVGHKGWRGPQRRSRVEAPGLGEHPVAGGARLWSRGRTRASRRERAWAEEADARSVRAPAKASSAPQVTAPVGLDRRNGRAAVRAGNDIPVGAAGKAQHCCRQGRRPGSLELFSNRGAPAASAPLDGPLPHCYRRRARRLQSARVSAPPTGERHSRLATSGRGRPQRSPQRSPLRKLKTQRCARFMTGRAT